MNVNEGLELGTGDTVDLKIEGHPSSPTVIVLRVGQHRRPPSSKKKSEPGPSAGLVIICTPLRPLTSVPPTLCMIPVVDLENHTIVHDSPAVTQVLSAVSTVSINRFMTFVQATLPKDPHRFTSLLAAVKDGSQPVTMGSNTSGPDPDELVMLQDQVATNLTKAKQLQLTNALKLAAAAATPAVDAFPTHSTAQVANHEFRLAAGHRSPDRLDSQQESSSQRAQLELEAYRLSHTTSLEARLASALALAAALRVTASDNQKAQLDAALARASASEQRSLARESASEQRSLAREVQHSQQFLQHTKLAVHQQEVMLTLTAGSYGRDSGGFHNRDQYGGYQNPHHQQRSRLQQYASPQLHYDQLHYDHGQQQRRQYHPNNQPGQQQRPGSHHAQPNYGNQSIGEMGVGVVPLLQYQAAGIGSQCPDSQRLPSAQRQQQSVASQRPDLSLQCLKRHPDGQSGGDHCDGMLSGENQVNDS